MAAAANRFTEDDIEIGTWLLLTKERAGIVKYKGPVDGQDPNQTFFGVELLGSVGKMSGSRGGKRYFDCEKGRGMLVKMDRIRKILTEQEVMDPESRFQKMGLSARTLDLPENESNEDYLDEEPDLSMEVNDWDVEEVARWVNQQLSDYGNLFRDGNIDGRRLVSMQAEDLRSLGLRPGNVRKLWAIMEKEFKLST